MAKEKMSQTQTSTKYAEPPIKINRALYGVLLASLASVFWGSMGVCVQYIFENTKTEPQALFSLRLLLSGIVLVILNLYLSRRPLLAAFSSLKGSLGIALSGIELLCAHLTFFIAIYYSNAGTAAIFIATTPLLAGIYLFLRGKKRFTAKEGLSLLRCSFNRFKRRLFCLPV
ncbi:DMT family transporter [Parasutterella sp.]|uniref:DMT family transporter n=1 Tax=Parasutterella sp. TaxID=2049037 RepID=UPI00269D0C6E